YRKIFGQVFAFGFECCGQAVQNQVRVEFADDANVKALHRAVSFFMTRSTRTLGSKRETSSFLMRAGSGARQLAAPQATARARLRSKESSVAAASAKPARAESPQPTVDLGCSGAVQA